MERYVDFTKIGEGSFGSVHRATDSETGEIVALKVFHNAGPEVSRSAVREARFLAECCHCNITALREAYQSSSGRIYLVLEYAQHVLSHQLKSHKKGLPAVAVRSIIFQLLQALHYLHSKGIMHRDCKPANILITSDGMVKLCDFGFARFAKGQAAPDTADDPLTSYVITRWYRPPEVLAGQQYTTAVDIWAVGCIFAEMLTGQPLFPGTSAMDQMYIEHIGLGGLSQEQQNIMRSNPSYPTTKSEFLARVATPGLPQETIFDRLAPCMSRSMMAFFKACLIPDPDHRASAWELLDTSFIKEGAWEVPPPNAGPTVANGNGHCGPPSSEPFPGPRPHQQHAQSHTQPQQQHLQPQPPLAPHPPPSFPRLPSNISTPRKSHQKKTGPTVKQRRADVVARMMDSDNDDEDAVAHLKYLPAGEPLSDPESDEEGRSSTTMSATITPPMNAQLLQTQPPQMQAQPPQTAHHNVHFQEHTPATAPHMSAPAPRPHAPMSAGFAHAGLLHTSFAPGAHHHGGPLSQPHASLAGDQGLMSVLSEDTVTPDRPRTSAPTRLSIATGNSAHIPKPTSPQERRSAFAVSVTGPVPVELMSTHQSEASDTTLQTIDSGEGLDTVAHGGAPHRKGGLGAHGHMPLAPTTSSVHKSNPGLGSLLFGRSVPVTAHDSSHGGSNTNGNGGALAPQVSEVPMHTEGDDRSPDSKPLSAIHKSLKRVQLPQSSSAMLLPTRSSMYLAKPMTGISQPPHPSQQQQQQLQQHSTSKAAGSVSWDESMDKGGQGQAVAAKDGGRAKPTAVQMTAAAITQASTTFAGMTSPWADTGPKSVGRRVADPECPPPPHAGHGHPQATAHAADNDGNNNHNGGHTDGKAAAAATGIAHHQRERVQMSGGSFHVSGRLSRVVPGSAGLVHADSSASPPTDGIASGVANLRASLDSASKRRSNGPQSNQAGLISMPSGSHQSIVARMSIPEPGAQVGDGQQSMPGQGPFSMQQSGLSKSTRMLSPMAMRLSKSNRHPSNLISTRLSESGTNTQQQQKSVPLVSMPMQHSTE